MPIVLTAAEGEFLDRVRSYCRAGLTQEAMAAQEGLTIGGFRARLRSMSLWIDRREIREVVRLRTGEPVETLISAGELSVEAS